MCIVLLKNRPAEPKGRHSGVNSRHHVVQNRAHTVFDTTIKKGGGPNFDDIKETEEDKENKKRGEVGVGAENESNSHADDFVDDDPAGIVGLVAILNDVGREAGAHDKQNKEGEEEENRKVERTHKIEEGNGGQRSDGSRSDGTKTDAPKGKKEGFEVEERGA